jgi:hypothetical protein
MKLAKLRAEIIGKHVTTERQELAEFDVSRSEALTCTTELLCHNKRTRIAGIFFDCGSFDCGCFNTHGAKIEVLEVRGAKSFV